MSTAATDNHTIMSTNPNHRHRYKLISCNVFMREICRLISEVDTIIDPEFTELGEHAQSDCLRQDIQARIDAADASSDYEAILLAFGLCGNAAVNLRARTVPLVIPRAHDCCTILLGSRAAFERHFGECPSQSFSSAGYLDRGEYYLQSNLEGGPRVHYGSGYAELVERYGVDNADYVWQMMYPEDLANEKKVVVLSHFEWVACFNSHSEMMHCS